MALALCEASRIGTARAFRELIDGDPQFRELEIPYATVGLDIVTRRLLVYSTWSTPDMKVTEALGIAVAVPFLYPPHKRGPRLIIDGALASPCPVWLATEQPESLPIVVLRPRNPVAAARPRNALELLRQLLDIGGASRDAYAIHRMDQKVIVDIEADDIEFDNFKISRDQRERLSMNGRRAAREALPTILAVANGTLSHELVPSVSLHSDTSDDDRAEAGGVRAMSSFNVNLSRRIRDRVFISYAREDEPWREKVTTALRPFVRPPNSIWSDADIGGGEQWRAVIDEALQKTKVAILLVTADFLASDFIVEHELPTLVKAAKQNGLALLWVAVGDSGYEETALKDFQAANDPRQPLRGLSASEVDEVLVSLGKQVKMGLS